MKIQNLSTQYFVRKLKENDVDIIFDLCKENDIFYQFHPPFVTKGSIIEDMEALPHGKENKDKFYIGYFESNELIAIMDIILDYPQDKVAFIGFFMMDKSRQGHGIGTKLISDCSSYLTELGYQRIRLAIDKGNPQSDTFWTKNGFIKTGEEIANEISAYMPMERIL